MSKLFGITRCLSDMLQAKELDLAKACVLVDVTLIELRELRSDEAFIKISQQARSFALKHCICVDSDSEQGRPKRKSKLPSNLEDSVVTDRVNLRSIDVDEYAMEFKEIIDILVQEIETRFSKRNKEIMKATQALLPISDNFFDTEALMPIIKQYTLDERCVSTELSLASKIAKTELEKEIERRNLEKDCDESIQPIIFSICDVIKALKGYEPAFPCVMKLLKIAVTLGVSSATPERSFSCLRRVKSYLRASMTTS